MAPSPSVGNPNDVPASLHVMADRCEEVLGVVLIRDMADGEVEVYAFGERLNGGEVDRLLDIAKRIIRKRT